MRIYTVVSRFGTFIYVFSYDPFLPGHDGVNSGSNYDSLRGRV